MSKKLKKEITTTVTNEDHFMSFYNENNKKLIVVDVYPGWSGPCTAMFPTYNQLMISIDDFEKRIDILLEGKIIDEVVGTNIPVFIEKVNKYIPLSY